MMRLFSNTSVADAFLIEYYKVEYFREWNLARKNGIRLTANDIRFRLASV